MATDTTLSRVGRFEFFTILAPGTYILSVIAYVIGIWHIEENHDHTFWQALKPLVSELSDSWPLGVGFFFCAYIIGNVLRAMPVSLVDTPFSLLFRDFVRNEYQKKMFFEEPADASTLPKFPFKRRIDSTAEALLANDEISFTLKAIPETSHTMYNYWKMVLCHESPDVFQFTQGLESRVRLFTGMVWAGCAGIFGAVISAILISVRETGEIFIWPTLTLFSASCLIVGILGWRLRYVRGEEVDYVLLGYLSLFGRHQHSRNIPAEINLQDLNLPQNIMNLLSNASIQSVGDLLELSVEQLREISGVGPKTIQKIEAALKDHGLVLRQEDAESSTEQAAV